MKVAATHFIIRAKNAKPSQVEPGEVFEPTDVELMQLTEARAVRELTEVEKKLHEVDASALSVKSEPVPADRATLEARANELKVSFRKTTSDSDLSKLIADAEAKAAEDTKAGKAAGGATRTTSTGNGDGSNEPLV